MDLYAGAGNAISAETNLKYQISGRSETDEIYGEFGGKPVFATSGSVDFGESVSSPQNCPSHSNILKKSYGCSS